MNGTTKSTPPGAIYLRVPPPDHLDHLPWRCVEVDKACRMTGRSARTVARWRAAGAIDDPACLSVLQTYLYGLLPHPLWREWLLAADGSIGHWSGSRGLSGFRPGDLCALQRTYDRIRDLRGENSRLQRLVEDLQRQLVDTHSAAPVAANDPDWHNPQLCLPMR